MIERTKYIPPIVSLSGGLIASLAAIINKYSSLEMMIVVLIALIVFYIAGSIIKYVANKVFYIPEPEDEESEEGEGDEDSESSEEGDGNSVDEGGAKDVQKEITEE